MAQKDKIKELVGRGLNSYHTKSLQQIDRIEKKNKQQNHKISILSNELDNDYLTKTEEGSVVSLEHSKEGMVYLDELQGNTLVNYCTDGSKEITLNGDIDLEGTFVTTTEGVDNGKVDVMCEGNTLVNLNKSFYITQTSSWDATNSDYVVSVEGHTVSGGVLWYYTYLKPSTTYTMVVNILECTNMGTISLDAHYSYPPANTITLKNEVGVQKIVFNTKDSFEQVGTSIKIATYGKDTTNKLKISKHMLLLEGDWTNKEIPPYFEGMKSVGQDNENGHKIEILSTNSDGSKSNKKEILLNEPLRGLPNGVKDRFVKIGGKWFIERNCSIEFNLADYNFEILNQDDTIIRFRASSNNFSKLKHSNNGVCNILNYYQAYNLNHSSIEGIGIKGDSNYVLINLNKSRNILSVNDLKNFIKNGLVFSDLQTPTYEPIEDVELITYLDTTHISNNSIIPCTMKIKNSGYNAIIKPSTLYTVALDTNKSRTIGMNLGGVKGTTTNNVLTLTTPAILTDDSLRLYGKGIKGSKVRLLEGDKTNWIPSHFEGMKSSFEDKFDATDNTYKMEILSSNKNMFNKIDAMKPSNWLIGTYHSFKMQLKPNTRYSVSVNYRTDKPRWMGIFEKPYNYDGMLWAQIWDNGANNFYKSKFTTPKDGVCYLSVYSEPNTIEDRKQLFNEVYNDLTIQEEIFGDEPIIQNSNKIQFSSIEPLRSVGNTKDKFVFKNNKLMIERNIGEIIIKDTILSTSKSSDTNRTYTTRFVLDKKLFPNIKLQTGDAFKSDRFKHTSWSLDVEGFGIGSNLDFNILNIRLSSLDVKGLAEWFKNNPTKFAYRLAEPTYEEIPFELQKIILEGYENGTLFFDTNIPPTSTTTYAGETPIVKSVKLNKTEVLNNTNDINDNIIPYLMDMDYRVVCLQLATEEIEGGVSMVRLFGGTYEMLQRDIQSNRYSVDEYRHRLDAYLSANKITEEEYNKLGGMLNE